MARQNRPISALGMYHVLLRGVDALFLNDADYQAFLELLQGYFQNGAVRLCGYLLLPNRVHLILQEAGETVAAVLKPLTTSYARQFNRTYQRAGKLFYDRYKSMALNSAADVAAALQFIHTIPRMQGLSGWSYTSYKEYQGDTGLCDTAFVRQLAGSSVDLTAQETPRLGMDDYQRLADAEIERYMQALCGYGFDAFKALPKTQKKQVLEQLGAQRWVSMTRLAALLDTGVHLVVQQKPKELRRKTEPKEKKKEELSFWLL